MFYSQADIRNPLLNQQVVILQDYYKNQLISTLLPEL